jgi:peptide/nickel transport system substrate-binding protein
MSRKSKLVALAAAGAAALVLSACGGSSGGGGGGGGGSAPAPADKTLHLSFLQDPGQPPDPDIFYAGQGLLLTTNLYDGLLMYKPGTATPTLEPALATKWSENANHTVFTFTLRRGVKFHDGTPFTAAAVKPSFDRRLAVNQGPAYMVADVKSVTTQGDYNVTITLNHPDAAFLAYLACAYGPKMESPTGLAKYAGTDHDQKYLTGHDLGTGPYELTDAKVGSHYAMKANPDYWGQKPYFTNVDIPVITDSSAQQLQFNNGDLAAILHDIPSSAVKTYLANDKIQSFTLPTMMSEYIYLNPNNEILKDRATRLAVQQAIDLKSIVEEAYYGRGTVATQVYPANMMSANAAKQDINYDPSVLKGMVGSLPTKSITIGYDSSQPDSQIVASLMQTELAADGLDAKVQSYPTSEIFGWVGNPKGAPDILATPGWPDAPSPYTWAHISFDKGAGLNYFECSDPATSAAIAEAKTTGSDAEFSAAAEDALKTGCWLNGVFIKDFMVAQPWLKGVAQAHVVSDPNDLLINYLSA